MAVAQTPGGPTPLSSGPAPKSSTRPVVGKTKRAAAFQAMAANDLKTPEDLAAWLNTARKELFERAEDLDVLAAELHSGQVLLRRRLLKAASKSQNTKEKWVYRTMVRRSLKPLRQSAHAAAFSADSASSAARRLRTFWKVYMDIYESVVPKHARERR